MSKPPRSHSLPSLSSTSKKQEMMTLNETQQYPSLLNPILSALRTKDAEIQSLDLQLRHRITISAKQNDELEKAKEELEQLRKVGKEQRVEFGKLRAEYREKQGELEECWRRREEMEGVIGGLEEQILEMKRGEEEAVGLKATIHRLEKEKVELLAISREGFEKKIEDLEAVNLKLEDRVSVLERKRDCLEMEVRELREGLTKRDRELDILQKDKKVSTLGKANLILERDEAKNVASTLLRKIQGLEVGKQKLDELVAKQEDTMEGMRREIHDQNSYIRRIKDEREDFRDKSGRIQREIAHLERENHGLKRKITKAAADLTSDIVEEGVPPAKRPRTSQSVKRDSIPQAPRAMGGASPDTTRSLSMSSSIDGRHARLPGNDVRKVKAAQQNPYSLRR